MSVLGPVWAKDPPDNWAYSMLSPPDVKKIVRLRETQIRSTGASSRARRPLQKQNGRSEGFGTPAKISIHVVNVYATTAEPLEFEPATSPTLNRTKRRTVMFSPSFAIVWLTSSPIVTDSSLMKCCSYRQFSS